MNCRGNFHSLILTHEKFHLITFTCIIIEQKVETKRTPFKNDPSRIQNIKHKPYLDISPAELTHI